MAGGVHPFTLAIAESHKIAASFGAPKRPCNHPPDQRSDHQLQWVCAPGQRRALFVLQSENRPGNRQIFHSLNNAR